MVNNWTNVTDLNSMLVMANNNTGGYFWAGILFMIFVVMTITMMGMGIEVAILSSAFVGFILGIILVYMGLVSWTYLAGFVGIILVLIIWISYARSRD